MIDIRPVRPDDLAAIAGIELSGDVVWGGANLAAIVTQPYLTFVAIGEDGSPGAFAIGILAADELQIANIVVAPPLRRCGIGAHLLNVLMHAAARRGAVECFLEVALDNAAAIALYRAAGFIEAGIRKNFYADGGDALVMKRSLESPANPG